MRKKFKTKPTIAKAMIEEAIEAAVPFEMGSLS